MTKTNIIKRLTAGFLTLAFAAGAAPVNVGGFWTQGTVILARAEGTVSSETIDFNAQGYYNMGSVSSAIGSKCNVVFQKGNGSTYPTYYSNNSAVRLNAQNTMTVSSKDNRKITSIEFKFGSGDGSNAITADTGNIQNNTWTGTADKVVFTVSGSGGHIRIQSIIVTYGSDEIQYTKVEAKSPTIEETGNIEYYTGSDNKLYIKDGDTYTETTLDAVTIPLLTNISQANVTFEILRQKYTGGELSPKYTVKIGNTILTEGTDFTVEGSTVGTAPGEYNITFYGMGDFGGSKNETWYIDALNTYNVQVNNGYIKNYDYGEYNFSENTKITLVPDDPYINGGWFAYNSSTNAYDILVSTTPNYSFYVKSNVSFMWKELTSDQIETTVNGTAAISFGNCTNMSDKYVIPVSGSWELPAGAKIVKGGTYRMYKDVGTAAPTQNELKNSGTWKTTSLKSNKGTFNYNINVSKSGSNYQKDLYVMTYVEYKLGNDTYTVMSNVSKQYTDDTITNY